MYELIGNRKSAIELGPVVFSRWIRWADRLTLAEESNDDLNRPGVYMWGHFHEPPDLSARPYPELPTALIYVGETKNLRERLGPDHSRLEHYRDIYPADRDLNFLYVSVYPIDESFRDDERVHALRAFTRFLEDEIYWNFTRALGRRAALDYKKGRDRTSVANCCRIR